jgi:hypothetical protein
MHGTVANSENTVHSTVTKYCSKFTVLYQSSDLSHRISIGRLRGDQIHGTVATVANSEDLIPFAKLPSTRSDIVLFRIHRESFKCLLNSSVALFFPSQSYYSPVLLCSFCDAVLPKLYAL